MIAVGTNQNMIYLGDHEIQGIYAGDLLIYPDTPEPPTPTGSTGSIISVMYYMDGQYAFNATNGNPSGWASKVQLDGTDGEEITINSNGNAYITGITPGNHWLVYTLTGDTIPGDVGSQYTWGAFRTTAAKEARLNYSSPVSLQNIDDWAFESTSLSGLTLPLSVTRIGYNAFQNTNLKYETLYLSNTVRIEESAFYHANLQRVDFSEGKLEYIGPSAFGFNDLRTIVLPASLQYIGDNAFNFNNHIGSVTFEGTTPPTISGVTTNFTTGTTYPIIVPSESLQTYQTAYPEVAPRIVPGPVMVVQAYGNNTSTMILGSGATSVGGVYDLTRESFITPSVTGQKMYFNFGSSSLDYLYIQFTGNTIPAGAFSGCTDLMSFSIPYGFTSIGASAFRKTRGTTYTIPASVTSIGNYAFNECTGATEMIFEGLEPPTLGGTSSLGTTSYTFPIYVPDEAVSSYQTASSYWNRYLERIKPISQRT